jgi:Rhodopirellula transposase DDE domain
MIPAVQARDARRRFREIAPVLNEQSLRRFVAMEARALGRGGVSLMSRISGLARSTIYHGLSDIRDHVSVPLGRIRKPGGGRKKKSYEDPTLMADLKRLVEPTMRGDPMRPLLWTTRSLRNLVSALAAMGHKVSPTVLGNLLRDIGYSLQANSKTKEGGQHIDRDAQFQYINTQATAFLAANEPVISVDTKKKESARATPGFSMVRSGGSETRLGATFRSSGRAISRTTRSRVSSSRTSRRPVSASRRSSTRLRSRI